MKARIRNTNIEVDVQPFYDETGYFSGFKDGYGHYYHSAALVFPDTPDWDKTDWSSFRREAAKDILPVLIEKTSDVYEFESLNKEVWCQQAIEWADELIKQLKEK